MSSSRFTANLGLCDWTENDRPKRADFVSDNSIIDSALGGHIADSAVHMSAEEKAKALGPFETLIYGGTGESTRTIVTGFRPSFAAVFKKEAPPMQYSGGVNVVNSGCASFVDGGTAGVSISRTGVVVTQDAAAVNGVRVSLNETGCQYAVIAFK